MFPSIDPKASDKPIARGLPASPVAPSPFAGLLLALPVARSPFAAPFESSSEDPGRSEEVTSDS